MFSGRRRPAVVRGLAAALIAAGFGGPMVARAQPAGHLVADISGSGSQIITMRSSFHLDAAHASFRTAGRYVVVEIADLAGRYRFVHIVVPRFRTGYRTAFNTPAQNTAKVPTADYTTGGTTFPAGRYRVTVVVDSPLEMSIPFTGGTRDVTLTLRQPVPKTVDISYGAIDGVTGSSPGIYRHAVHVTAKTLVFVAGYISNATYQLLTVPPTAAELVNVCAQKSPAAAPCADTSTAVERVAVAFFDDYSEWTERVFTPGALAAGPWDAEVDSLGTAALGPLYPEAIGSANVFGIPFACIVAVNV